MIRDFSVKPASYGRALSGLGQTLADYREERDARDAQKKKERAEEIFQLSYGVYQQPPEQRRQAIMGIGQAAMDRGDEELAQSAFEMSRMDDATLNATLEGVVGRLGGKQYLNQNKAAVRGFEGDLTFVDEKGNYYSQQTFIDPNTQTTTSMLTDISGRGVEPVGKITPVSRLGQTAQQQSISKVTEAKDIEEAKGKGKAEAEIATAEKVGKARAKIAGYIEQEKLEKRDLANLKNTSTGRKSSLRKAKGFLEAFKSGEAKSGKGRELALYAPIGTWTTQGEFDELFNAFAEVAARQQLKASGETRPTDADVQGMKNAIFGVGRDEQVNIQLLEDYIADMEALERRVSGDNASGGEMSEKQRRLQELRNKQAR